MSQFKPGTHLKLMQQSNGRCFYCGVGLDGCKYHIDHILPFSKSKDGSLDNLCVACIKCNKTKSDLTIEEFRNKVEMILNKPIVFFFEHYGIYKEAKTVRYGNTLNQQMF